MSVVAVTEIPNGRGLQLGALWRRRVAGNKAANGLWYVQVVDANSFQLFTPPDPFGNGLPGPPSDGSNSVAYVAGTGVVKKQPVFLPFTSYKKLPFAKLNIV
jgi:hypothetical protein